MQDERHPLGRSRQARPNRGAPRDATCASAACWEVDDIEKTIERLREAGAEVQQAATDVGGGKLIAVVKDADGNVIGLAQSP